jgi:deoxycytidine triphosphate deaminase
MILGIDRIFDLIRSDKLLQNLSTRDQNAPEGAGIDLRVGQIHRISGQGFLGVESRDTPEIVPLAGEGCVDLEFQSYYLFTTAEEVNLPSDLVGLIHARSTLFRSGVVLAAGIVSPGYRGELTFGAFIANPSGFRLELQSRVAHITFHTVEGATRMYRGQWQDGRITTDGKELQT